MGGLTPGTGGASSRGGPMTGPAPTTTDRWYSGPAADRRAYAVDDITGIEGGQGRVVRAERRTFAGDPVGYCGPVSLKLTTERPAHVDLLRGRWGRLAAIDHPHVARALEVFDGPGLFDATSDRWALGMVTVFALLGHPQGATSRAVLADELDAALAGIGYRRRAVDLLCAMVAPEPAGRPKDAGQWARDLAACLPRRRARQRARALALVTAAVAAGLVAATTSVGASGGGAGTVAGADGSSHDPRAAGGPSGPTVDCPARPPSEPTMSDRLAIAVDAVAADACPVGPPEGFADAEVQPLAGPDGVPDGVVVLAPGGEAARLTPAMWTSYREIAGKSPHENATRFGGYPVTITRTTEPDAVVITLTEGGVVVGRRDDTQLFWVPQQVLDEWQAHGGAEGTLGFPTTNPYFVGHEMLLDFEQGYMRADIDDLTGLILGVVEVETALLLVDPAEPLQGVEIDERIVRQTSGSAWWVDADGARHWIPDGAIWACLGGAAAVAIDQLPGWAVASLPLGDPAACP
jgi:hypothetical protein